MKDLFDTSLVIFCSNALSKTYLFALSNYHFCKINKTDKCQLRVAVAKRQHNYKLLQTFYRILEKYYILYSI